MNRAVISLGSNVRPQQHLTAALAELRLRHDVLAVSKMIQTKPVGFLDQPEFTNAVALIETLQFREELKEWLTDLEDRLGRQRGGNKSGPRTIDLDIVVWNGLVVDPDVYDRDFLQDLIREVLPELQFDEPPQRA